jgi:Protein of unknown function (DUF732)
MFSRHRITVLAATAIAATAVGLAPFAATGIASANSDDVFLAQLRAAGITFDSAQGAINGGHQVCRELAAGESGTTVAKEILSKTDLTPQQAATVVVAATNSYCSEYSDQLSA